MSLRDTVARKRFRLVFHNPNPGNRTEGEFLMELEPDQQVDGFRVKLAGKLQEAELLDQEKARGIYEDIVRKRKDPALLEYYGSRLLRVRLFPLPPRSDFEVEIETIESLRPENGVVRVQTMHAMPSLARSPLRHVTLEATISSSRTLGAVFSPTHQVDVTRKDAHEARLRFERRAFVPADPLTFLYGLEAREADVLAFREPGEDGTFMLTLQPPDDGQEPLPRDILFLVDRSGSMNADGKMARMREALGRFIEGLDDRDRFNILPFSTEASAYRPGLVPATPDFRRHAALYARTLRAGGGTNLEEALALAAGHEFRREAVKIVLLLSDGLPTIGERDTEKLAALAASLDVRLFAFGIGYDVNTRLLDRLALDHGGDRQYVHPNEDLEGILDGFARKIGAPVLADPVVRIEGGSEIHPKRIPDLHRGGSVVLYGRFGADGPRTVELEGTVRGRRVVRRYPLDFTADPRYDFVPRLWAIRKVDFLIDQIRRHGDSKEVVDHIVELAKRHGIVTPYTSFLMTEDAPTASAARHVIDNNKASFGNRFTGREEWAKAGNLWAWRNAQTKEQQLQASNDALGRGNTAETIARALTVQRQVGSRNFTARDNAWVDGAYVDQKARVVRFASPAYFRLLRENPAAGKMLALGNNVTFWNLHEWVRVEG